MRNVTAIGASLVAAAVLIALCSGYCSEFETIRANNYDVTRLFEGGSRIEVFVQQHFLLVSSLTERNLSIETELTLTAKWFDPNLATLVNISHCDSNFRCVFVVVNSLTYYFIKGGGLKFLFQILLRIKFYSKYEWAKRNSFARQSLFIYD